MTERTLPNLLLLVEDGYHDELPRWKNPEIDDPEWIGTGWKVSEYGGTPHFQHKDKSVVEQWLSEHGYYDTGDGAHYRLHAFEVTCNGLEDLPELPY